MLRIAIASALLWPGLRIGLLPPLESMRISDQNIPVAICTEATFEIGILSSELPKSRGLMRNTRSGPTSMRVGKKKLPWVKRLATNKRVEFETRGAVDMGPILRCQPLKKSNGLWRGGWLPPAAALFSSAGSG